MRHANLTDPDGDRLYVRGTPEALFVTVRGEDGTLTAGGFTRAQIEELLDAVAPAGSYTRTDEKDWQAHAERAERALAEMTVHRDQCRDTAIKWQMEANRAVQARPITPDAITDEMVERGARQYIEEDYTSWERSPALAKNNARESVRGILEAALTEPTRPKGAEDWEDWLIHTLDHEALTYQQIEDLANRVAQRVTEEQA